MGDYTDLNSSITLDLVSFTKINNTSTESVEQDQFALV